MKWYFFKKRIVNIFSSQEGILKKSSQRGVCSDSDYVVHPSLCSAVCETRLWHMLCTQQIHLVKNQQALHILIIFDKLPNEPPSLEFRENAAKVQVVLEFGAVLTPWIETAIERAQFPKSGRNFGSEWSGSIRRMNSV